MNGQTYATYARYVIGVHVVMEDGFQMLLYTLISACQVKDSVSVSAGLGVLRCVIFFLFKTSQVSKLNDGQGARLGRAGQTAMI